MNKEQLKKELKSKLDKLESSKSTFNEKEIFNKNNVQIIKYHFIENYLKKLMIGKMKLQNRLMTDFHMTIFQINHGRFGC